jgi:hypothetical protein
MTLCQEAFPFVLAAHIASCSSDPCGVGVRNLVLVRICAMACAHPRRIAGIKLNASVHLMGTYQEQALELFVWTLACNLSPPVPLQRSAVLPGLGFVSQCLALAASRIPLWMGCGPNCGGSRHRYDDSPVFFTDMHAWLGNHAQHAQS